PDLPSVPTGRASVLLDGGADTGRQHDDLVTGAHGPCRDLTGVAAVVGELGGAGTDHVLHREAQTGLVPAVRIGVDGNRLEVLDEDRKSTRLNSSHVK